VDHQFAFSNLSKASLSKEAILTQLVVSWTRVTSLAVFCPYCRLTTNLSFAMGLNSCFFAIFQVLFHFCPALMPCALRLFHFCHRPLK